MISMRSKNQRRLTMIILMSSAIMPWSMASAQDVSQTIDAPEAQDTGEAQGAGETQDAGGEIIVTARKRSESVMRAPVIVSAVSSMTIKALGITSIADFGRTVPQLVIGDSPSVAGGAISLWGITSSEQNQFNDQSVSFSIDGTQISRAAIQRMALMDLEQVAVYKGPQALFFGKNSYAGVVDIRSADPTSNFEFGGTIGYEFEGDEARGEAFISGPVAPNLGARLAVYGSSLKGYLRNTAPDDPLIGPSDRTLPDSREVAARFTLLYDPAENFSLKFKLGFQDLRSSGIASGQQLIDCPFGVSQTGGTIDGVGEPCRADGRVERSDLGPNFSILDPAYGDVPYHDQTQWLASVTANYAISDQLELTSVSSLYTAKSEVLENFNNATAARFVTAGFQTLDDTEVSQELRLRTKLSGSINFLVGAYYQYSDLNRIFKIAINAATPSALFNDEAWQKGNAYSFFGQAIWKPANSLEIAVGGRYSDEKKRFSVAVAGQRRPTAVPKDHWNNFSPEATVTWYATDDITLFGSYKRGFLSGGFNAGSGDLTTDRSFDEQVIKGGEVGSKLRLLDNSLSMSVAGYYYTLTGLQVLTQVGFNQFVQNAGKATVKGIDFSWDYRPPVEGLSFQGAFGYNRARYDEFVTNCYAGQTIALGCNLLPNSAGVFTGQDLSGRPLLRAPSYSANAGFVYRQPVNDRFVVTLNGHTTYSSSYFADPTDEPRSLQDSYWLFDAGISLQDQTSGWKLSLLGRNLSNELYVGRTRDNILTGSGAGRPIGTLADISGVTSRGREVWLRLSIGM